MGAHNAHGIQKGAQFVKVMLYEHQNPVFASTFANLQKLTNNFCKKYELLAIGGSYEQEDQGSDGGAVQGDYPLYEDRLLRLPPQ